jgi:TolB protein
LILFESDRDGRPQIYSMNADGTGERRVINSPTFDFGADWSADGKWIVCSSGGGKDDDPMTIDVMRADGSERRTVATFKEASWPRFSPDGRRIAFTAVDAQNIRSVYTVNSDGTNLQRFPTALTQSFDPEWSPDGRQLLFSEFPADMTNPKALTLRVYVANDDGKERRLVSAVHGFVQLPRWSPDGKRIAYQTYTGGKDANIVLIDFPSGNVKSVTRHDHEYLDEAPSWLPDGRLLFQSDRDDVFEIYRMNADGTSQERMTKAAAKSPEIMSEGPAVSGDASRVVYLSNKNGSNDLYVASLDGSNEVQLTNTPDNEGWPSWSPDQKRILFSVFADGASRIYSVDPDGKNLKQIGGVPGRTGALSPDGRRVLYWTGSWTAVRLFVSNLDGSDSRMLVDTLPVLWNTKWSPDGKRIAYTGRAAGEEALSVWIMSAGGADRRQVTHISADEGHAQLPAWSPDGKQLAFQVSHLVKEKRSAHIWIIDLVTGAARKLNPHTGDYQDEVPSWFSDGKRIAFQSDRTGRMEIWTMNADGSDQRRITGK